MAVNSSSLERTPDKGPDAVPEPSRGTAVGVCIDTTTSGGTVISPHHPSLAGSADTTSLLAGANASARRRGGTSGSTGDTGAHVDGGERLPRTVGGSSRGGELGLHARGAVVLMVEITDTGDLDLAGDDAAALGAGAGVLVTDDAGLAGADVASGVVGGEAGTVRVVVVGQLDDGVETGDLLARGVGGDLVSDLGGLGGSCEGDA